MRLQENRLIAARARSTDVNLEVPNHLQGDHNYAWMAKQMNLYGKQENKAWTIHSRLSVIVGWYGGYRISQKRGQRVVSYATQEARSKRLVSCFTDLWALGYRIEEPRNLSVKHVELLVKYWTGQIPAEKKTEPRKPLSASTLQNRLSCLRSLCIWLNKENIVKNTSCYATELHDLKRSGIATRDKSWNGNEVDFDEVLARALIEQMEVGMQMLMMRGFGLRLKEAICFDVRQLRQGVDILWVEKGAKGGLGRAVPVTTDQQRDFLAIVQKFAMSRPRVKHLGLPDKSLVQSINRTYAVLKKLGVNIKELGVTVHGLRHEFAHEVMERAGLTPPIKGGASDQMPKGDRQSIEKFISGILGHSRVGITAAYAGSFHTHTLKPLIVTSFSRKEI